MKKFEPIIVECRRGPIVESYHTAVAAIVDNHGHIVEQYGDPEMMTFWRSAAKPIQATPWVRDGTMNHWDWNAQELAITCASHVGAKEHTDLVSSMLDKMGLTEKHLRCDDSLGISHNCSGNHTGFLAACVFHGWDIDSYYLPDHPAQLAGLKVLAETLNIEPESIPIGNDGCGILTWATTVSDAARVFSRLPDLCPKIASAMRANPVLIDGEDKMDCGLMKTFDGIICKGGAEAIVCVSLPNGYGLSVKVTDGSYRAMSAATVPLVARAMGCEIIPDELSVFATPPLKNGLNEVVGSLAGVLPTSSQP